MNFTTVPQCDGFGAQYQKIIQTYIYCKLHNQNFLYTPFTVIEHNYDDDEEYIKNIEKLINLKLFINNIDTVDNTNITQLDYGLNINKFWEMNIDKIYELGNIHIDFIKDCFWQNKEKGYFKNGKINIAVHIRRYNAHDNRKQGTDTPDNYYLNIIKIIKKKYKNENLLFHIYSQGEEKNFTAFKSDDTILHINEDICSTFLSMVTANILVTSASSLSYTAALISDGEIYYKKFWHNPRKEWIKFD